MIDTKDKTKTHPTELELADFLDNSLSKEEKERLEGHIACCSQCLERIVSCHDSVAIFNKGKISKKGKAGFMKKVNIYLVLAIAAFALSFIAPRYFIQFLVATLLLGIKWIIDAKSTKMLVMIYEAWKKGGEKEASRILEHLDEKNSRF